MISDWNMEPMTGYELLRHVRADDDLRTTPFIMVTAESKTENVIAAKKAGVNNYIVKPFNAQTLKTKIEACAASDALSRRKSPRRTVRQPTRPKVGAEGRAMAATASARTPAAPNPVSSPTTAPTIATRSPASSPRSPTTSQHIKQEISALRRQRALPRPHPDGA